MNRSNFYAALRGSTLFPHGLSEGQVRGMEALLDAASALVIDEAAYVFATAYHETAATMQPIAEYGKGKGREYGVPGRNGGQIPYGRGFVQTTWDVNYERTDRELGLGGALIKNYDLLLTDYEMAAKAAVRGMVEGWYTGKDLDDYMDGVPLISLQGTQAKLKIEETKSGCSISTDVGGNTVEILLPARCSTIRQPSAP